jgi:hypothetical protein
MSRDRLENNARALASVVRMPETTIRPFIEMMPPKFTDEHGHVLVVELATTVALETNE